MLDLKKKSDCSGCSACKAVCPQKCIELVADTEGFLYPVIDKDRCINCGLCDKTCPVKHPPAKRSKDKIKAFAAKNKDRPIRIKSSSGGVFSAIAERVITSGGVVVGASFDKDMKVVHKSAQTTAELVEFRGSKYVQSDMGDTFIEAKKFLDEGKLVLFSGTPCQISGLSAFLKKPYDNLILIDCICMGVPSPMVWDKYARFCEKEGKAPISKVAFRDKKTGWKNYSISLEFENKQTHTKPHNDDLYMRGFSKLLFIRPACHDCKFKSFASSSDITLGDYWGVHTKFSDFDDDLGVSLILANTIKGLKEFNQIANELTVLETDIAHAEQTHRSMMESIPPGNNRGKFYELLGSGASIEVALANCTKQTPRERLGRLKRRILG